MVRWLVVLLLCSVASAHAGQWVYEEQKDKMTGKRSAYAQVESDNSLRLGAPYAGRNHGTVTVRQHPQYGLDVVISVEKGQILCRSFEGCSITVRFGDAKPQRFSVVEPADYSSETVFVTNRSRFIAAARKHKRFLVQIPMYQEGDQVLEFSVPAPLVWK